VTTSPHLLLQTIRSRARILQFGAIPQEQIEEYLVRKAGRSREDAQLQALLCEGSLSTALALDSSEYRSIRAQALQFTRLLLAGDSFAEISALAASLAKQKDSFRVWIDAVLLILQDAYYAKIAPERMGQKDLQEDLKSLTRPAARMEVLDALKGMKRLRKSLRINVNRQLALEALFLEHRAAYPRRVG
jgi:DNA polymerase III gamma/tau subunit